ncbi:hypothetical protein MHK_010675 [Candidatus Magnetomorum sp. HK-1]|nr:hypothetical protein MHK_010675 [Candidatus Magnetomorum sp. HK-1]
MVIKNWPVFSDLAQSQVLRLHDYIMYEMEKESKKSGLLFQVYKCRWKSYQPYLKVNMNHLTFLVLLYSEVKRKNYVHWIFIKWMPKELTLYAKNH